jgi:peptide/nickel transport system substrate-binding protein
MALLALILVTCAPQPSANQGTAAESAGQNGEGPSRLTLAIQNDISVLATKLQVGPGRSGGVGEEFSFLSNSPLVVFASRGAVQPRLATEVPSQERGTWLVNSDGTMATTWKIRPDASWHDGQSLTSQDFLFALKVYLDPEIEVIDRHPERLIVRIEPLDGKTFVIHWRQLYLSAHRLLIGQLEPLPEHILADLYNRGDRTAFQNAPFWTTSSYIGSGPYVLTERAEGVQRVYRAFHGYFLGRPKIEEVVVRMMSDQNTALANVLGGAVDATLGSALNQQSGLTLQQEWDRTGDGRLVISLSNFLFMEFQHHPERVQQPALLDVRVRRGIVHGVDRVALNEVITGGRAPVPPEVPVHPDDPLYPRIRQVIPSYPYDPGRAVALLAEVGWTKRADRLVNASDEGFKVDIRTVGRSDNELRVRVVAGYLTALGMEVTQTTLSVAEDADREHRARFPGMGLHAVGTMELPQGLRDFTAEECAAPENRYAGRNRRCWSNAEFDRLFRIATSNLDEHVRGELTLDMLKIFAEDVAILTVPYSVHNQAVRKGLVGPAPRWHAQPGTTWNIPEWRWT